MSPALAGVFFTLEPPREALFYTVNQLKRWLGAVVGSPVQVRRPADEAHLLP